ncbi:MAG: threonine/homoserine/homoserine lactone efflux protein [Flavobacteriaceae bacterium]|jgi:threonine/homoserine/homoserine lactone efflux protein|uniref:LysE family translocator n=1 Tax=Candidatus Marifrigoribacter sp. Uisw_064 TaxID=3230970 RepID=UPI003ADC2D9E
MSLLLNFIIGIVAAIVGVIPPGFLNLAAAKISMSEGRKRGLLFSLGVSTTVFIQTYIALLFARYLDNHPDIVDMLQKVALGIFLCITIYFFFIAKDIRKENSRQTPKSKTNRFFSGMFLSVLNLLPLPYWVYISITFSTFGWFKFSQPELLLTVLASAMGTFLVFASYVWFFRPKESPKLLKLNMNYIIGTITAVISIITFFKILKNM